MRTVRFTSIVLASVLVLPFALSACGDDGGDESEGYATLQDCFDDHHGAESLSVHDSIVVCCLDHPIDGVHPSCGSTAAECQDHVELALDDASATVDEIDTSCQDYVDQL